MFCVKKQVPCYRFLKRHALVGHTRVYCSQTYFGRCIRKFLGYADEPVRHSISTKKDDFSTPHPPKDPPDPYVPNDIIHEAFDPPRKIPRTVFRKFRCSTEVLGPNADKCKDYKNPEYFSYHRYSFVNLQRATLKLRKDRMQTQQEDESDAEYDAQLEAEWMRICESEKENTCPDKKEAEIKCDGEKKLEECLEKKEECVCAEETPTDEAKKMLKCMQTQEIEIKEKENEECRKKREEECRKERELKRIEAACKEAEEKKIEEEKKKKREERKQIDAECKKQAEEKLKALESRKVENEKNVDADKAHEKQTEAKGKETKVEAKKSVKEKLSQEELRRRELELKKMILKCKKEIIHRRRIDDKCKRVIEQRKREEKCREEATKMRTEMGGSHEEIEEDQPKEVVCEKPEQKMEQTTAKDTILDKKQLERAKTVKIKNKKRHNLKNQNSQGEKSEREKEKQCKSTAPSKEEAAVCEDKKETPQKDDK